MTRTTRCPRPASAPAPIAPRRLRRAAGLPVSAIAIVAALACAAPLRAQPVIDVPQDALPDESFFQENEGAIVNVNDGGVIGPLGRFMGRLQFPFRFNFATLNINSGGLLTSSLNARSRIENVDLNVRSGGRVGSFLEVSGDSEVTVEGGRVGDGLSLIQNAALEISGGTLGDALSATSGAQTTIVGDTFRLDGELISGFGDRGGSVDLILDPGSILSGTLADGTPFMFSSLSGDSFGSGGLRLSRVDVAPPSASVITTSTDPVPLGVRDGQTLIVDSGSVEDDFNAGWGSTVRVLAGGAIGDNLEAVNAQVRIEGGSVGDDLDAFAGTEVVVESGVLGADALIRDSSLDVQGGVVGEDLRAHNATVEISGGTIGDGFLVSGASETTISGGVIGAGFESDSTLTTSIRGGRFAGSFLSNDQSFELAGGAFIDGVETLTGQTTISGARLRLNGEPMDAAIEADGPIAIAFGADDLLTGVFADGTSFAFSGRDGDVLDAGTLLLDLAALPDPEPDVFNVSTDPLPIGVRGDQTVIVGDGAMLRSDYNVGPGATARVEAGGVVGENLELVGGLLEMSGGEVGARLDALDGSTVDVSGGSIGEGMYAIRSEVNLHAGSIAGGFRAVDSVLNVTGGQIDQFFNAIGSTVNVSGGSVPTLSNFVDGSNLVVSDDGRVWIGDLHDSAVTATDGSEIVAIEDARDSAVTIDGGSLASFIDLSGAQLVLRSGLIEDDVHVFGGSDVLIEGGLVENDFLVEDSVLTMTGGEAEFVSAAGSQLLLESGEGFFSVSESDLTIMDGRFGFAARHGSDVLIDGGIFESTVINDSTATINGGVFEDRLSVVASGTATINGGEFAEGINVETDGFAEINDGSMAASVSVEDGGEAVVHGGRFERASANPAGFLRLAGGAIRFDLSAATDSSLTLEGAEFRIDGELISLSGGEGEETGVSLTGDSVLSGVFADGTPFAFSSLTNDRFDVETITLRRSTPASATPGTIDASDDDVPLGVRDGQTLFVGDGAVVEPALQVGRGGRVEVDGGHVGDQLKLSGGALDVASGQVGRNAAAFHDSAITVSGGSIGESLIAVGATIDASGGVIGEGVRLTSTSLNVNGATVGEDLRAEEGSSVMMSGGEIGFDASFTNGSTLEVSGGRVRGSLSVADGHVELEGGEIDSQFALEGGSTLDMRGGSVGLGLTIRGDSTANVHDGEVGDAARILSGELNLFGGSVGDDLEVATGGAVLVAGGRLGSDAVIGTTFGGALTLREGVIGSGLRLVDQATGSIEGGVIEDGFTFDGGTLSISGGVRGSQTMLTGDALTLVGDGFQIDGAPVEAPPRESAPLDLPGGATLTGVLADGTPFALSSDDGDTLEVGSLTLERVSVPEPEQTSFTASTDQLPLGVRGGQTLVVDDGGAVGEHFVAGDESTVRIESGGTVGRNFEAAGAEVRVEGGSIANEFTAFHGSDVIVDAGSIQDGFLALGAEIHVNGGSIGDQMRLNEGTHTTVTDGSIGDGAHLGRATLDVLGGSVGDDLVAVDGAVVNLVGGSVGRSLTVEAGAEVNISGGTVAGELDAVFESTVNISGGTVGSDIDVFGGARLHLLGQAFFIDGEAIEGLATGEMTVIDQRDVALSGVLEDGSMFAFELNSTFEGASADFFSPDATLTVTLIPAPGGAVLLALPALAFRRRRAA